MLNAVMARIYDCSDRGELLEGLRAARTAIARGDVIVMPTDTVYGVAADAFSPAGVQKLLETKERGRSAPPPVLVPDAAAFEALAERVPDEIRPVLEQFAPGPITVILPARSGLSWDLGDTRGTVALRIPDHEIAIALLRDTGPLAVSSANLHGQPAAASAEEAERALADRIDVFLDGGVAGGQSSTILDATPLLKAEPQPARIVRQGALSRADLERVLGEHLAPQDASE